MRDILQSLLTKCPAPVDTKGRPALDVISSAVHAIEDWRDVQLALPDVADTAIALVGKAYRAPTCESVVYRRMYVCKGCGPRSFGDDKAVSTMGLCGDLLVRAVIRRILSRDVDHTMMSRWERPVGVAVTQLADQLSLELFDLPDDEMRRVTCAVLRYNNDDDDDDDDGDVCADDCECRDEPSRTIHATSVRCAAGWLRQPPPGTVELSLVFPLSGDGPADEMAVCAMLCTCPTCHVGRLRAVFVVSLYSDADRLALQSAKYVSLDPDSIHCTVCDPTPDRRWIAYKSTLRRRLMRADAPV
jgi:hypothetical protein